jgi:hypothetical protein
MFIHHFADGHKWIPKSYAKVLIDLHAAAETIDECRAPDSTWHQINKWDRKMQHLLRLVRTHTPVVEYPEFLVRMLNKPNQLPGFASMKAPHRKHITALEFDYFKHGAYYASKPVLQTRLYCAANAVNSAKLRSMRSAAARALGPLEERESEYVLGWNNRFEWSTRQSGTSNTSYLLFLDIDSHDQQSVVDALRNLSGWIFNSGSGFHFVGSTPFDSQESWKESLVQVAQSKELNSFVDPKFVELSLVHGYSTVRIGSASRNRLVPFLLRRNPT